MSCMTYKSCHIIMSSKSCHMMSFLYHSLGTQHYLLKNKTKNLGRLEISFKEKNAPKNNTTSHVNRFLNTEALRESLSELCSYEKLSQATRPREALCTMYHNTNVSKFIIFPFFTAAKFTYRLRT